MKNYNYPQFKLFVSYWVDFLQAAAIVCRRHKKVLESNEILGLFLVYTRYGAKVAQKHVSNTLYFLKAILPGTKIEEDEINNHKIFTTRYIKRVVGKGLLVAAKNEKDNRVKMYEFAPALLTIIHEVAKEFELQDRILPTLIECQSECSGDAFIPE